MIACIGYIVPEVFGKFPGELSPSQGISFESVPNGLGALSVVPVAGWAQIFLAAGALEYNTGLKAGERDNIAGTPGDYGWKVLTSKDPEERTRKLQAEIANSRLAMVAILAMLFQNGTVGSTGPEMWIPGAAFESELGVQPPVGFWDPLGFTRNGDELAYKRRRVTELKHGRVCMLATLGYIVPETLGKFRGELSPSTGLKFSDIPNGLAAISKVPAIGWVQIIAFAGCVEGAWSFNEDYSGTPGDYGWKAITSVDEEIRTRKLNAELANGRLAMMAIIGMFFQDGLTGQAWGDWSLYTDSPMRAFENELGVQDPVGFWDPVGFTRDGDVQAFKRRRATELKHGRLSMIACIGYIVPEVFGKFPGELSPSQGISFESVPNGLGALSVVPVAGWAQIFLAAGALEYNTGLKAGERDNIAGTPGDYGWKVLTSADPEEKKRKLQAEIANSRLAMVAILAMLFQNGTVGSTGPEMWIPGAATTEGAAAAGACPKCLEGTGGPRPNDFWDPAGLTKGKTEEELLRFREAELKHGRVAMLATLGWFHTATGYHPIGDASMGFFLSDDPLVSMKQISVAAWVQLGVLMLFLEWAFNGPLKPNPKYPWDLVGWNDIVADQDSPAWKEVQLRELNNGRLAMLGFVGMVHQDVVNGDYIGWLVQRTDGSKPGDGAPVDFKLFEKGPYPILPGYEDIEKLSPVFGPGLKNLF